MSTRRKTNIIFILLLSTFLFCGCPTEKKTTQKKHGAFHGHWLAEEELCYKITHYSGEIPIIDTPPNETWRIEIENIRIKDEELLFDQYHYMPVQEDLKTIFNPSGEHPFSGVKCETKLSVDPANPDKLKLSMKTKGIPEPTTGVLVKQVNETDPQSDK